MQNKIRWWQVPPRKQTNYATIKLKISLNKAKSHKNHTNDNGGIEL